mmetsp:Transcript_44554/g.104628  ORF Transcript_44554/g.104628 Transcript_44554/m.104628 type:complete len:245 (+) Transcript_44554:1660-2394(+)
MAGSLECARAEVVRSSAPAVAPNGLGTHRRAAHRARHRGCCRLRPGRDRADGRARGCTAAGSGRTRRRIPPSPGSGHHLAALVAPHGPTPAGRAADGASVLPARAGGGRLLTTVAPCFDPRAARRTQRQARDPDGVPGAVRREASLCRRRRRHVRDLPQAGAREGAATTARTGPRGRSLALAVGALCGGGGRAAAHRRAGAVTQLRLGRAGPTRSVGCRGPAARERDQACARRGQCRRAPVHPA